MINLLPPKRRLNIQYARSNTVLRRYLQLGLLSTFIIVVAVFVTAHFFTLQKNNTEKQLQIDTKKVTDLESVHEEAKELAATVNTIAALMEHNIRFSDLLLNIGGIMPEKSVLTGLEFSIENTDAPLVVSAEVDSEAKAAVLRNNLAASTLFNRAEIKSIIKKEGSDAGSQNTQQAPLLLTPQSPEVATPPPGSPQDTTITPSPPSDTAPLQAAPAPAPTPAPVVESPYKFQVTINAYFKPEVLRGEL